MITIVTTTGMLHQQPASVQVIAVNVLSLFVPRAMCLTHAFAVEALSCRAGYGSQLRIGVARPVASGLDAHTWVELDGWPVIGCSRM